MRGLAIALVAIGAIAFLFGMILLVTAILPSGQAATFTIPSGQQWYYVYSFSLLGGGRLSGTFQELTGGNIDVYVFTDAQYQQYHETGSAPSLFAWSGTSGQWNVALPGADTFYLVFDHGSGYGNAPQDVRIRFTVNGIGPPSTLAGGAIGAAVGVTLLAVGFRKRGAAERTAQAIAPPPASNVVFYPPPSSPPEQSPFPPKQPPPGR